MLWLLEKKENKEKNIQNVANGQNIPHFLPYNSHKQNPTKS